MMSRKMISMLLALAMVLGLGAGAFAAEEPQFAPPPAAEDVQAPLPGEGEPSAPVTADLPADTSAQESAVTLLITGAAEAVDKVDFCAPDGSRFQAKQDGIYDASGEGEPVLAESTEGLRTQLEVQPEQKFTVTAVPGYDIQAENGTVVSGDASSGLVIQAPAEGTVTLSVAAIPQTLIEPEIISAPETETVPETVTGPETVTAPETATEPETVTAPETATEPETVTDPEAEVPAETEAALQTAAAAQDVTVALTGAVDKLQSITYLSPDNTRCYTVDGEGIHYNTPAGVVWVTQSQGIPAQFTVAPGTSLSVYTDAAYAVSADTGAVTEDSFHSFPLGSGELVCFRQTEVQAPASGSLTVTVAGADGSVPAQIPFKFYNEDWDNGVIVGGGSVADGQFAWNTGSTVIAGGSFEVWTGPGYEIQVLEGGSIVRKEAPSGAGAAYVPAGSVSFVLQVDLDAEKFVIAAVKEGETFTPPDAATGTFKDVPDNSWYKDVIEQAYAAGLVTGMTADTFAPNGTASRGQTVTMLWRQAGSPSAAAPAFQDLTADYYRGAVAWAAYVKAVNGTSSTSFSPDMAISRQDLATVLYRMAGKPGIWSGGLVSGYSDSGSIADYAKSAMQWALDNGLINGYEDGTLRPDRAATRAEVCALLMRYRDIVNLFPTEPAAPTFQEQAESQNVSHTERNLSNPKLIRPKRDKIDDGLYDNGEDGGRWIQQWSETYWDLDRSGEDIMWCTRNLTRLYSGPGTDYEVVYTLYSTYEVSRLGPDENGWTPVVYHEYETGSGFTGWDHTGYVRTDKLSKVVPSHPHVADFSSGPALEKWCYTGIPEGDLYADYGASANGTFYHEAYDPSISGDTYTYTLRGGGHIIIHNVLPEGLHSVEVSGEVETHSLLLFVYLEKGYGIQCSKGYGGGYGLSCSGDNKSCEVYFGMDVSNDEDIELTMFHGDGAPRVLQVTLKDKLGGSRMGDGASRFVFLDSNGNVPYAMADNFFNLKGGYKLKSLSPYATVGKVENNELHHFSVKSVPEGTDQIWFEVVRK